MGTRTRRTALATTLMFVVVLAYARPTTAAAPRVLLVYGGGLDRPVILSDWEENLEFMTGTSDPTDVRPEELEGRPYLELALFWGPEWTRYVDEGQPLAALQPEQANQHGRFYPAYGERGPVLTLGVVPGPGTLTRRAEPRAAEVLLRHGIPAGPREQAGAPPTAAPTASLAAAGTSRASTTAMVWIGLAAGVAVVLLVGALLGRRRAPWA